MFGSTWSADVEEYILANHTTGTASGAACNCLIDTLQQLIRTPVDVKAVRQEVNRRFKSGPDRVTARGYLDFTAHSPTILELMRKDPALYRLVCVDLEHGDHGAVVGSGHLILVLGCENNNHFVPRARTPKRMHTNPVELALIGLFSLCVCGRNEGWSEQSDDRLLLELCIFWFASRSYATPSCIYQLGPSRSTLCLSFVYVSARRCRSTGAPLGCLSLQRSARTCTNRLAHRGSRCAHITNASSAYAERARARCLRPWGSVSV